MIEENATRKKTDRPNILFLLVDQLRASSLPLYGEDQIETPNIDRLAREGVTFENCIASNPVCTPYRSMLLTGRHPQTTGHIINFVRTRHDEIGLGDVFARNGYRTGWIGKWHLHTGAFPETNGKDFVPEGRDRLGFDYWRGYNFHMTYFDGWINVDDWHCERWEGYETGVLNRFAFEFLEQVGDDPFCLFISPHQPHFTPGQFAPDEYYSRLPETLRLPANVPEDIRAQTTAMYRHYLAMTLSLDDMLGELLDYLDRTGRNENTLVVFTSDHGTQVGAHGINPWQKKLPYEESLRVPLIMRLPGVLDGGRRNDVLTAPVDFLPSFCSLCGIDIPRTVEGYDISEAWRGISDAFEQDAVLTMNHSAVYDFFVEGLEWRGVRTKRYNLTRRLDGTTTLHDIVEDPLQLRDRSEDPDSERIRTELEQRLDELMTQRGDELVPCSVYRDWFDNQRRVIRNAFGPMGDPEDKPDWSLLR